MPQRWEYLFVDCNLGPDTWRPRFANREPLPDWETGTSVHEFCNRLGADGWELVNLVMDVYESAPFVIPADEPDSKTIFEHSRAMRLVFKRRLTTDSP